MRFGATPGRSATPGFLRVAGRTFCISYVELVWLAAFIALLATDSVLAHANTQAPSLRNNSRAASVAAAQGKKRPTLQTGKSILPYPLPDPVNPLEKRERLVHRVRAGDSFAELLGRYGLTGGEKQLWVRSLTRNAGRQSLVPGREIQLYFAKPTLTRAKRAVPGQLKALEFDQDDNYTLSWERSLKGIQFHRREKPFDVEVKSVSGEIETSLFEDGRKAGVHPKLLSQLADIFTWDVDIEKAVGRGNSYKILYEQRSRKGQENRPVMRILAAELNNAGQTHTAIYFEKQKGQGNYYNLAGRSLARSFLRFPLEFTSITSHFAESRFHPILKTNLPHVGIDFAALRGTPVRAVGDGVVAEVGWNGGYGRAIDVRHDSSYTSRYAHLQGFAPGIRSGVSVIKGQIIGYVGSTGRATGPHLHFELYRDRQFIDPLSVDFPAEESIEPALLKVFEYQTRGYLVELSFLQSSPPQS